MNDGETPLHWGVSGRHAAIVRELVAVPGIDINAADKVPGALPPILLVTPVPLPHSVPSHTSSLCASGPFTRTLSRCRLCAHVARI